MVPRTHGDVSQHLPCLYWPAQPSLQPPPVTGRGAPPILVVGNHFDPATPYQWSVAIAGQLESARLLTRIGIGHIGTENSVCVDVLVENYLLNVTPPAAGASCPSNPSETTWALPPDTP